MNWMGLNIIESPHVLPVPVLQIDPQFEWCTPAQRAKTNQWLLDTFGTKRVAYMFNGNVLVSPAQAARIRNFASEQNHLPPSPPLKTSMQWSEEPLTMEHILRAKWELDALTARERKHWLYGDWIV
jgi:hypothetical protein